MSYASILDYLGELRSPERIDCPPGGTAGCNVSDAYLCVIAEQAKTNHEPLAYLRGVALKLSDLAVPGNWQCAALTRITVWCDEFRQTRNFERNAA